MSRVARFPFRKIVNTVVNRLVENVPAVLKMYTKKELKEMAYDILAELYEEGDTVEEAIEYTYGNLVLSLLIDFGVAEEIKKELEKKNKQ